MWPHIVSCPSIHSCCRSGGELEGRQPASQDTTCPEIHASWGIFCIQRKTTPIHAFCLLPACWRTVAVHSVFAHSEHQADGTSFCWHGSRGWRRVPEQPVLVEPHQRTGTLRGVTLMSILMWPVARQTRGAWHQCKRAAGCLCNHGPEGRWAL